MKDDFSSYIAENAYWIFPLALTVISAATNAIISIANVKVSKGLKNIQNDSFCFQLYDRRFEIYESIQTIIVNIIKTGTVSQQDTERLIYETRDVEFLFGKPVQEKCNEIYDLLNKIQTVEEKVNAGISRPTDCKEHERNCDEAYQLKKILVDCQKELKEVFQPYLSFENYRIEGQKDNTR